MTAAAFYSSVGAPFGYSNLYDGDHHGVDIVWGRGVTIPCWCSGTVVAKGYNDALGYYVVVDRGFGYGNARFAGFCHMVAATPRSIGDHVELGTTLGFVGTTGDSTGYHTHCTLGATSYPGTGPWVDPLPYINAAIAASTAGGGTGEDPNDDENEDDMANNKAAAWWKPGGGAAQMNVIYDTSSGFWDEWQSADGGYNTSYIQSHGIGVNPQLTLSHINQLRADCEAVRTKTVGRKVA